LVGASPFTAGCSAVGDGNGGGAEDEFDTQEAHAEAIPESGNPSPGERLVPVPTADDTDGNGIPDDQEWGLTPAAPADTDWDGIPDYEDLDDDNDYLLDIADANRVTQAEVSDVLNPDGAIFLTHAVLDVESAPEDVARAGNDLLLHGEGLGDNPDACVVIFVGASDPINVLPASVDAATVRVQVPENAGDVFAVAVAVDGRRSNWLELEVLDAVAPVLADTYFARAFPGQVLTLRGTWLNRVMEVRFGELVVAPTHVLAGEIKVVVPPDAPSGWLTVHTSDSVSNAVDFRLLRNVEFDVVVPADAAVDISQVSLAAGLDDVWAVDADGQAVLPVIADGRAIVFAMHSDAIGEPSTPLLAALTVPGDVEVTLDARSTAVALAMMTSANAGRVASESLAAARDLAALLPEVVALAGAIEDALAAGTNLLVSPTTEFDELTLATVAAADSAIGDALQTGAFSTSSDPIAFAAARGNAGTAEILPEEERYNIAVRQIEGTGNIRVENETLLYLSVQIRDLDGGRILQPHVSGFFDPNMVRPQHSIVQFWRTNVVEYPLPNYRSAEFEIITAGFNGPDAPAPPWGQVFLRTFVDQMALPLIGEVMGATLEPKTVYNLLVKHKREKLALFGALLEDSRQKGVRADKKGSGYFVLLDGPPATRSGTLQKS